MTMRKRWSGLLIGMVAVTIFGTSVRAQAGSDFAGIWKQDNERCQPKRNGDVTLRIEQDGLRLTVETSVSGGSGPTRQATQSYTTDGKVSVSTGADGDEFHTAVIRKAADLVFSIEEHEDGRILRSREIWSIIDNGATLERLRERAGVDSQLLFFRRQQ